MERKRFLLVIACTVFIASIGMVGGSGAIAQIYVLKYGHVDSVISEDHEAAMVFKDFVDTRSKGKIKVELYPNGQLGNFRELLESVAVGSLEMTNTTCGGAANLFPEIQVTDLPYIFPDERVAEKVYEGWFVDKLREFTQKKMPNLRLMVVTDTGGWRSFATKNKLIRTPSDLKGVKVRTIESDLHVNLLKSLGGTATPVPWPETYTAIKTGIVDGVNLGIAAIVQMKFHETIKYFTLDNHMYLACFYWMNNKFYMSLPNDLKKVVLDGLYHAKWFARGHPKRAAIDAYEAFVKAGGTFYVPSPEEKAQFVEAAKPVRQWFIDKYGKEWVDIMDKAVAEAAAEVEKERAKDM